MPVRRIDVPQLGRSLSALMAAPSSAEPDTQIAGLSAYHRMGGHAIHLHGEGGETHSRRATGEWLREHGLRQAFFLCTQICHDEWDDTAQRPIDRFTPEAVHEDITTDLELLETNYLDLVYLDDRPDVRFESVIDALGREIANGRVCALGVRNWTADRICAAHDYAAHVAGQGITALITTELSPFASTSPLWPEYVPFDSTISQAVRELELVVFAHAGDATLGQCLFGDEEPAARMRPEWVQRWQHPANADIVRHIREIEGARRLKSREIQIVWMLNQSFPVVAIIGVPSLSTDIGGRYERASQLVIEESELFRLR